MAAFGKWVEGISADATAEEAALEAVRVRIAAVRHYLVLAAEGNGQDPEDIHQLRVCSRRSAAALNLFDEMLPKRHVRRLKQRLRKIRRAAGDARELDVLLEAHLSEEGKHPAALRVRLRKSCKKARKPVARIARKMLKQDRLVNRAERLRKKAESHASDGSQVTFGTWARDHLRDVTTSFFATVPGDSATTEALHQFRIQGKELRYAMELLAPAFPAEFRENLYPRVEELQERLGKINDHSVAIERIRDWILETSKKGRRAYLREELTREQEQLSEARAQFLNWWTPEFATALREDFERLLSLNETS